MHLPPEDGTKESPSPRLLKLTEVCRLIGCAKSTVYSLAALGHFDIRKRGNSSVVVSDQLNSYIRGLPTASIAQRKRHK